MKTLVIVSASILFTAALFVSLWLSTPSIEELQELARNRDRYALVPCDRFGRELAPYYTSANQTQFVPLDSVPQYFTDLLIFYEDRSFEYNLGFSPTGILRSLLGGSGGGSTITQQTFRLLTQWKERTILRKAAEIIGSFKLTMFALSKEKILERYINLAHFGGSRSGLMAASQKYFGKKPKDLTRGESIMLLSFLNKPPKNIARNIGQSYEKYRHRVQMALDEGMISEGDPDYQEIAAGPEFNFGGVGISSSWIFMDRAYEELKSLELDSLQSTTGNMRVETTLDKSLNDSICVLLSSQLEQLPLGTKGAFLLLDQDNEIICYVSGMNLRGDFDFLMSDHSMPASRFKIPVCADVIEKLLADQREQPERVANMLIPTRFEISKNRVIQDPGPPFISFRDAISESRNAALYWLANNVTTPQEVVDFARYFDLDLRPYPSIPMGTQPVSELKLAWMYSTLLVRDGFLKRPIFVRRVFSQDGNVLYDANKSSASEPKVVSSTTCKIIRQLLREAEQRGTSSFLGKVDSLEGEDISPKTGTTKKFRQLGVTGSINQYTFSLLIQGKELNQPASKIAVPILSSLLQCMKRNGYF